MKLKTSFFLLIYSIVLFQFYCAIEDINTQDLLLLFITENRLGENNETIFSTCNLISYSKQNLFSLSNIDCSLINNDSLLNTIE